MPEQHETAMGVLTTLLLTPCVMLVRHGFGHTIVRWIKATVEGCLAAVTFNDSFRRVVVPSVAKQRVLSSLPRCLVDDLIARLNGVGVYTQGYADDISFGRGEIPKHGVTGAHALGPSHYTDLVRRDR